MYNDNFGKLDKIKVGLTFDDVQILPTFSRVSSRSLVDLTSNFTQNKIIKLPFVSAPMKTVSGYQMLKTLNDLGGVGILHRFMTIDEQNDIVKKLKDDSVSIIAVSIGVNGDCIERALDSIRNGANVILIDVAHGATKLVQNVVNTLKKEIPSNVDIIAGNVATYEETLYLLEIGVDAVRVGIGGGSLCETRIRTGIGVPQLTAIDEAVRAKKYFMSNNKDKNPTIIADGGIRYIGDIAKAIGCGADTVMMGSMFAGTDETPGDIQHIGVQPNVRIVKKFYGSASLESKENNNQEKRHIEGNSTYVEYKGTVKTIIEQLSDGLRSSMSYTDSLNINEFQTNCSFIRTTPSSIKEAYPHLLIK